MNGASPNTSYNITESATVFLNGSGSYGLAVFKTDSNGDGTASAPLDDLGGDMLQVVDLTVSGAGYIAGFSVPQ